jgi:hypothetical protein
VLEVGIFDSVQKRPLRAHTCKQRPRQSAESAMWIFLGKRNPGMVKTSLTHRTYSKSILLSTLRAVIFFPPSRTIFYPLTVCFFHLSAQVFPNLALLTLAREPPDLPITKITLFSYWTINKKGQYFSFWVCGEKQVYMNDCLNRGRLLLDT